MGKTHSGGETMRLVIEDGGEWVALMVWGSACYRLKPRDEFIGWAPSLRAARQKLVVMAMMSGANSVKAIWRFGERLTMAQRKALHFPHDKDRVGKVLKAYYKIPRYETIYKFLQ